MARDRLYTIVFDYKRGTYLGQAFGDSVQAALSKWLSQITDAELLQVADFARRVGRNHQFR